MPTRVKQIRTEWKESELAPLIKGAFQTQSLGDPSDQCVHVTLAKFTTECGWRGHNCWNHNVGNIRGSFKNECVWLGGAWEEDAVGNVSFPENQAFRAYPDFLSGLVDYVDLLANHYRKALDACLMGHPAEFVQELKNGGYFTGNLLAYSHSVCVIYDHLEKHGYDHV